MGLNKAIKLVLTYVNLGWILEKYIIKSQYVTGTDTFF